MALVAPIRVILNNVAVKKYKVKRWRKVGYRIHKYKSDNFVFKLLQVGCLEFMIYSLSALAKFEWNDFNSFTDGLSSIFVGTISSLLIVLPFYMIFILFKGSTMLMNKKFKHDNGWIYEELSVLDFFKSIYYSVFYLRRGFYALILVSLRHHASLQLIFHLNLCIFFLIYVGQNNPF